MEVIAGKGNSKASLKISRLHMQVRRGEKRKFPTGKSRVLGTKWK